MGWDLSDDDNEQWGSGESTPTAPSNPVDDFLTQGYVSPYSAQGTSPRQMTNNWIGDYAANAGPSALNLAGTAEAIAAPVVLRPLEAQFGTGPGFGKYLHDVVTKPWEAIPAHAAGFWVGNQDYGQQSILPRATDPGEFGQAMKGMAQYLYNERVKPFLQNIEKEGVIPPDVMTPEHQAEALDLAGSVMAAHPMLPQDQQKASRALLDTAADIVTRQWPQAPFEAPLDYGVYEASPMARGLAMKGFKAAAPNLFNKTVEGMHKLGNRLDTEAPWIPKHGGWAMPGWLKDYMPSLRMQKDIETRFLNNDTVHMLAFNTARRRLYKAWKQLPDEMQKGPMMTVMAELTDPRVYKMKEGAFGNAMMHDPRVQNFLNVVRDLNNEMDKILHIPEELKLISQFGPMLLAMMDRIRQRRLAETVKAYKEGDVSLLPRIKALSKQLTFDDLYKDNHGGYYYRWLERLQAYFNKHGLEKPTYASIQSQPLIAHLLHKATSEPFGGGLPRLLKESKEGQPELPNQFTLPEEERLNVAKERRKSRIRELPVNPKAQNPWEATVTSVRKLSAETNLMRLCLAKYAECLSADAVIQGVRDLAEIGETARKEWAKNPAHAGVDPHAEWENINLDKLMAMVAKHVEAQGGNPLEGVKKAAESIKGKGSIKLPPPLADYVKHFFGTGHQRLSGVETAMEGFNKLWGQANFGADPMFGTNMAIRSALIQAMATKRISDIPAVIVAYIIMAKHPQEVNDILPPAVTGQHSGGKHDPYLFHAAAERMDGLAKLSQLAENWSETTYAPTVKIAQAEAMAFMLYMSKNELPAVRNMLKDIFETSGALDRLAAEIYGEGLRPTPDSIAAFQKLQRHMYGTMGNYTKELFAHTRAMRVYVPLLPWVIHAWNMINYIPEHYPRNTSLMSTMQGIKGQLGISDEGQWPEKEGPNGKNRKQGAATFYHYTPGLAPLRAGIEMAWANAAQILFPNGNPLRISSTIGPGIIKPLELLQGYDMARHKLYAEENPDWEIKWSREKKQMRVFNKKTGKDEGGINQIPMPWWLGMGIFGKQINAAQRVGTYDPKTGNFGLSHPWIGTIRPNLTINNSPREKGGRRYRNFNIPGFVPEITPGDVYAENFGYGSHPK